MKKLAYSLLKFGLKTFYGLAKEDRVILLSPNLSGSNTFALYKNMIYSNVETEFIISTKIKKFSYSKRFHFYKRIYKSKIIVGTHGQIDFATKNSMYIETWHGFPLKTMLLLDKGIDKKLSKKIQKKRSKADYYISYSDFYNTVLNSTLGLHWSKYIITGYPRNDFLFYCNRKLLKKFHINEYFKIIFYLPTFRKSIGGKGVTSAGKIFNPVANIPDIDLESFCDFLEENSITWLMKPHILSADYSKNCSISCKNIVLIADNDLKHSYTDLYELLACADLLITDYSSVYFDFLLLNKPIIFIPTDIEEYRKKRGFLLEPYDMWTPGPKVYTQKELQNEILKSLNDPSYYAEERERLKNIVHYYQDANSSKRVWEFINSLIEG